MKRGTKSGATLLIPEVSEWLSPSRGNKMASIRRHKLTAQLANVIVRRSEAKVRLGGSPQLAPPLGCEPHYGSPRDSRCSPHQVSQP